MQSASRIRRAGTLYLIGGAAWLVWIIGLSIFFGGDPLPGTSFFYISEIIFIIIHTLLFVGLLGLWWSQAVGEGLFGKIALAVAWVGHLVFILAELFMLTTTSAVMLPVGALTSAVGLLLTGIAVLQAKRWQGWSRYAPLLAGLYPFIGMFPVLLITGGPNGFAIGLWGLFRLLLGLAIYEQANPILIGASYEHQ